MGAAVELSSRKRTLIFINVNISTFSGTMLGTALTTALPPIMDAFDVSLNTAQWLTSGFSLTMSIIIPLTSYLMNRFRTKRLYLAAITFFLTGLTIALCSVNFPMLLTGRIVQACGSGLISSLAQTIILTIYPPERRGYAMGWYGLSLGAAPIIAPTISGILVDSVGWRSIFVLAMIIMVICLIYTLIILEDVIPNKEVHFDIISFILSALTFGGIILAIGNFGTYKFVSYQVLMVLIIGIVAGIFFTYRQLHIKVPFLDLRVFKHIDFTIGVITTFIIQLILNGSAVILPVYFQNVKGYSATISGLAVLPGSLALSVISPFAGKIYDNLGIKMLFIFAGVVSTLSNLGLFFITINTNIWVVAIVNIARCLALGVITMPAITWGMKKVPESKTADGTATQNSFRIVSMSIGTALFVSIMTTVSNAVKDTKAEPDLFGIKIVFLCMAMISLIVLLFGIFTGESKFFNKNKKGNSPKKDIKNSTEEIELSNNNAKKEIEIVINENQNNDSNNNLPTNK